MERHFERVGERGLDLREQNGRQAVTNGALVSALARWPAPSWRARAMRAPPCGQLYVPPFGPNLESLEPRRPFRRAPQARDPRPAGARTTRSETVAMAIRSDPGLLPVVLAWSKSLEPPPIESTPPAAFGTPAMIVGSLVIVGLVGAQIAPFLLANPTAVGFVLCALLAAIAPNATEVRFSASYSPPYFSVMGLCAAVEATALVALLASLPAGPSASAVRSWLLRVVS